METAEVIKTTAEYAAEHVAKLRNLAADPEILIVRVDCLDCRCQAYACQNSVETFLFRHAKHRLIWTAPRCQPLPTR